MPETPAALPGRQARLPYRGAGRTPGEEEASVAVARCTFPHASPQPWWLSSGPVVRRSRCALCQMSGASPLPGPQRSTAARVATTSAVVAAFVAEQHLSRAASWTQPCNRNDTPIWSQTCLSQCAGCGGGCGGLWWLWCVRAPYDMCLSFYRCGCT